MFILTHEERPVWQLLDEHLKEIKEVLEQIKQEELSQGQHALSENLSVNYFSYHSAPEDERSWEAHSDHIDVHVLLEGEELIALCELPDVEQMDYDKSSDSYSFESQPANKLSVKKDDWLIIGTNEGHKTGVAMGDSQKISKAVFKIKVGELSE